MDGRMDGWKEGWMDGRMDGRKDGWMEVKIHIQQKHSDKLLNVEFCVKPAF